ncbi:MAG: hypothetical protein ACSHX0_02465 [Akkermansiaceae bacterium]
MKNNYPAQSLLTPCLLATVMFSPLTSKVYAQGFVASGSGNSATGTYSFVGSGEYNSVPGFYSFVGAGDVNSVTGTVSFVGAGSGNGVTGYASFSGAGEFNTVTGGLSFVGSGDINNVIGDYSFIGSGSSNEITGYASFVGAGEYNNVTGGLSFIGAGEDNNATGYASSVVGGGDNYAAGDHSFATGTALNADSYNSAAIGRYNTGGGDPLNWVDTDPLFEIGNGFGNFRSNALTVYKNGNMELQGDLTLGGIITSGGDPVLTTSNFDSTLSSSLSSGSIELTGGIVSYGFTDFATAMSGGETAGDYSTGMSGGLAEGDYSTSMSGGYSEGDYSTSMSGGEAYSAYSTGMTGGIAETEYSTAMSGGYTLGEHSLAAGLGTVALAYSSTSLGIHNESWGSSDTYVDEDPVLLIGNGTAYGDESNALEILKNGQTTLINKAWKAATDADSSTALDNPASTSDSDGNALVVDGHTLLNGKVILAQAQGDISMGIFGE